MSGLSDPAFDESGATKRRLDECRERANAAEVEISRLKAVLRRIADEVPHYEPTDHICPACMAEVGLRHA